MSQTESGERAPAFGDAGETNPFTLPSDEEVFRMRDEERRRKAEERQLRKSQKIWDKGKTNRPNLTLTKRGFGLQAAAGSNIIDGSSVSRKTQATQAKVAEATAAIVKERRQDKESMAEFVAKKREMFLVQMSLDTKRDEIRKLEEKAKMKEEALKKSEQMLEEDAVRFDTFLKENDKKAHEAIRKAERETKLKQDKVHEIKKLNQQIQMAQSDMSKHKETLEDCLAYKAFLDALTPPEYFEAQLAAKRERQEARRNVRVKAKKKAYEEERKKLLAEFAEEEMRREESQAKQGRTKAKGDKKVRQPDLPPPPKKENEPLTSSEEDMPMYFEKPRQLLDIFQALEEQNLLLIQNSQETEHALEELKQTFHVAQESMNTKTQALQENIDELEGNIKAEEAKAAQLHKRIAASTGDTLDKQEELLQQLHSKATTYSHLLTHSLTCSLAHSFTHSVTALLQVRDVYERCGFDATSSPTTLFMLSDLEARLEDLLSAIEQMPEGYVVKAEKEKEKRRREKKRVEQQALQEQQQEERNRKAIERTLTAPKKQAGRKVMQRHLPTRRKVRVDKSETNTEDLDELRHLT
ncbi:unnamed protein product [Chrysoparadoxa australica]